MPNSVKDQARALLDSLPDDCTFDDIQYHLYVAEKVKRGIKRAESEPVLNQEQVEKKFAKWLTK
ncbi:MAG TPA: hypothetical protein PKM25_16015 [Candidatus Ozemobacteraceae bacterium]|nr:hypothetical protein [Candidatus Ozemobacteraceae bacterium]